MLTAVAGFAPGNPPDGTVVTGSEPILAKLPVRTGLEFAVDEFAIYVPAVVPEPARVLVVLHGMGGNGVDYRALFEGAAEAQGWIVVAPTFPYGDWRNPSGVTREASAQLPRIINVIDTLHHATGITARPRAFVYGYSRGGQTANRLALSYPERVGGVAIVSAGTYTVPARAYRSEGRDQPLAFPFGVNDLASVAGASFDAGAFSAVPFWIGVGENDVYADEVPREWDPYIGRTRVERAHRFADWVRAAGASAEVEVFPGVGHGEVPVQHAAALRFLKGLP